ncbi:YjbE family putative metal transport protein [Acetobacteraceae bacterium H6797]|nr:YjbE family putative metal transport protein [Acetobacteraceae bacterium H6797]
MSQLASVDLAGLLQIIWLNAILSGDNAVVIGLAAAGLPEHQRNKAVLFGVIAAAVLRIIFSIFAAKLLEIWWIDIVGGLLLIYIAWGFFKELSHKQEEDDAAADGKAVKHQDKTLMAALWQIVVADVSMSLDNVLAIASVAKGNFPLLIVGLTVSIIMMGLLGGLLARLLDRFKIIAWIGLALIVYIALKLLYEGLLAANAVLALGLPLPGVSH